MSRKIKRLSDHVIICGYGRNGSQAAFDLAMHRVPFIVIENNPEIILLLRDNQDILYIDGDATQDEVLEHAGIADARAMITTLPADADNLYVVLTAKGINPKMTIISRASNENSDINPSQDVILSSSDKLFVLGTVNQINQLKTILAEEVESES